MIAASSTAGRVVVNVMTAVVTATRHAKAFFWKARRGKAQGLSYQNKKVSVKRDTLYASPNLDDENV